MDTCTIKLVRINDTLLDVNTLHKIQCLFHFLGYWVLILKGEQL